MTEAWVKPLISRLAALSVGFCKQSAENFWNDRSCLQKLVYSLCFDYDFVWPKPGL